MPLEGYGAFTGYLRKVSYEWMHLVLSYIGPNYGQGIRVFKDGVLASYDRSRFSGTYIAGDARLVVGRKYVDRDDYYTSVEIDELIFFNEALSDDEVRELYNMYQ